MQFCQISKWLEIQHARLLHTNPNDSKGSFDVFGETIDIVFGETIDILQDMNTYTAEHHQESAFEDLFQAVSDKINY
ncbi:hypothetical protein [Leptolyngbya sp. NIES-2104]|uniref:hypothetical protein n=1 Tax=Leptolyngbya sp. NIES-2104 TaxID=1552121 RepID=UPI0006EC5E39|nr:hypothetical protein [Leptolyngbya sp. NIES-2104]GAP95327.1 hypothetical protein NIES2104_18480 [Leptolyngbya sp. NIES-2104]